MAGLFSLGGGGGSREATTSSQNQSQNPAGPSEMINPWGSPPGVVLYRNEEVYQKGFEIWQQYVQVHHHHHPAGAVIPVAGGPPPNLNHPHFQPHHPDPALYQLGDSLRSGPGGAGLSTRSRALRSGSMGGIGGGINCQDCGNQAKKDCAHMRCRTCCKSRGFDCPTHVKSTWVPAALRRERQQQLAAMQQQQNPDQQQQSQHQQQQRQQIDVMRGGEKRIRHSSSMSIVVPSSRLAAGGSCAGLEVGQSFPSEVSSPAVFRCVRVTSTNDTEEHLAYQTAVSIAGHVFKGILYDQGPEGRYNAEGEGEDSPRGSALQQHNLLTGIGIATGNENIEGEATTGTSASAGDAAGGLYSTPINAFLAGTQFFPPPRS